MPTVRRKVSKTKDDVEKPSEKSVDDIVGKPLVPELPATEVPQIEKGDVAITPAESVPSVSAPYQPYRNSYYSERMIPDANLPTEYVEGVLDIATEGSGLLRPKFAASDNDVYISASQIRRFNLRVGDKVGGQARQPKENERYWGLLKVETVNAK